MEFQEYGYFDSEIVGYDDEGFPILDRAQNSEIFALFFAKLVSNGVLAAPADCLMVQAHEGMTVNIAPGFIIINGHFGYNPQTVSMTIDKAPSQYSRITAVIARVDYADRKVELILKNGDAAVNPASPEILQPASGDFYELCLAKITVNSNQTVITQSNITDTRYDSTLCGVVTQLIDHLDTSVFNAQLNAFYNEYVSRFNGDYADFVSRMNSSYNDFCDNLDNLYQQYRTYTLNSYNAYLETIQADEAEAAAKLSAMKTSLDNAYAQYTGNVSTAVAGFTSYLDGKEGEADTAYQDMVAALSAYMTAQQTAFETWFNNIKGQLSTDAAGHLQNEVDGIKNKQDETDESAANLKAVFEKYVLQNRAIINSLSYNQLAVIMELETLKAAEIAGTNDNVVIEVFDAAVTPKKGYYDEVNRKVYA